MFVDVANIPLGLSVIRQLHSLFIESLKRSNAFIKVIKIERMARSTSKKDGDTPAAGAKAAPSKATANKVAASKSAKSKAAAQDGGIAFGSRNIAKKKKKQTKSQRAGITFPISRVLRSLRQGNYANRVFTGESTRFHHRL